MPFKDPQKKKEYQQNYYQIHKIQLHKVNRPRTLKWQKDNPDKVKVINANYHKTHRKQRIKQSMKWHKNNPESIKLINQNWRKNHPEQLKIISKENKAKRRKLGFIPLNEPFEKSDAHHIDFEYVIYIPEQLHDSIKHCVWTGKNMEEINNLAWAFLHNAYIVGCYVV